jgi:hypothetical protein
LTNCDKPANIENRGSMYIAIALILSPIILIILVGVFISIRFRGWNDNRKPPTPW